MRQAMNPSSTREGSLGRAEARAGRSEWRRPPPGVRRRTRRLTGLVLAGVLAAGCSSAPFSAAWNPYAAAPPGPSTPWRSSDGKKQPRLASLIERLNAEVQIDPDKEMGLADLIDLAQRVNPET